MAKQRRDALQFLFDDAGVDDGQAAEGQCLGGGTARLGRQQGRLTEDFAFAEGRENDPFFVTLRGDFDFAVRDHIDG
jgi:hypothetical protein